MKKKLIGLCIVFIILFCSFFFFTKRLKIDTEFIYREEKKMDIFAVKYETKKIEKVQINYFDPSIEKLTLLYTKNSNLLPEGYISALCPNATILSIKNEDKIKIIFDRYIVYSYNIELGFECLQLTISDIYEKEVEITYI